MLWRAPSAISSVCPWPLMNGFDEKRTGERGSWKDRVWKDPSAFLSYCSAQWMKWPYEQCVTDVCVCMCTCVHVSVCIPVWVSPFRVKTYKTTGNLSCRYSRSVTPELYLSDTHSVCVCVCVCVWKSPDIISGRGDTSDGIPTLKRRNVLHTINYTNHKTTASKVALVRKNHVTYYARNSNCFFLWMNQLSGSQRHTWTRFESEL